MITFIVAQVPYMLAGLAVAWLANLRQPTPDPAAWAQYDPRS